MALVQVTSAHPIKVSGATTLTNRGPDTVYYDSTETVGAANNEGSIASSASVVIADDKYVISTGVSTLSDEPIVAQSGQVRDAVTGLPLSVVSSSTFLAGTLVATENGVTTALSDIGPALQTLLAAAAAAGKRVYMPAGTYNLATAVAIPAGTHLYGDGMVSGTKIRLANAFPTSHPLYNAVSTGFNDVYIHDIEIDGNAAGQSGDQSVNGSPNELIFLSSAAGTPGSNVVIERVYAHDSYRLGIVVQNIDGGAIRHCRVKNNGRDGITLFDACKRFQILGNRVTGCNDDHIAVNSETGLAENIVVQGNILTGPGSRNLGKGIRILGGRNIVVQGNVIDSVCEIGIYLANKEAIDLTFASVIGNTIRNTGTNGTSSKVGILVHSNNSAYHAVSYSKITDVVIANNVISAALGNGIELRSDHNGADELARIKVRGNIINGAAGEGITLIPTNPVYDSQIEDNHVSGCTGHGILVDTAKRVKLIGNTVHDNGAGGTNTYGIRVLGCDVVLYTNNLAYDTRAGGARTQTVGIYIATSTSAIQIGSNLAYNNATTQWSHNGIGGLTAFDAMHGAVPAVKATVTGSRGGNAALADLLTKLASKGVVADGSSA